MSQPGYRPEIDGLRALAIVPVVIFHLLPAWLGGGYLGVDVFFVISGYLITTLVLRDVDAGTFSVRRFWARRVRRLAPALLTTVAATLACGLLVLPRFDLRHLGEQSAAALLSVANIFFWRSRTDYWAADSGGEPLLHTWSLAVEEQFYLLFPVVIPLVARLGRRLLALLLVTGTAASLVLFIYGSRYAGNAAFYLLPTRAWELGMGCCLALAERSFPGGFPRGPLGVGGALVGIPAILVAYGMQHRTAVSNIVVVLATAAIIAGSRHGVPRQLLAAAPLPLVGRMSYSIYLWHWPVIVFAKALGQQDAILLQLLVALGLAIASYKIVETPARHAAGTVPWCGFGLAAVLGLALATIRADGYDVSRFDRAHSHAAFYSIVPSSRLASRREDITAIRFMSPPDGRRPDMADGIVVGTQPPVEFIFLGDSHGLSWGWVIESIARSRGVQARVFTAAGVSAFPLPVTPLRWTDAVHFLAANTPMKSVEERAWCDARIAALEQATPAALVIFGPRWDTVDESRAKATLAFLADRRAEVILIEQPPEIACTAQDLVQYLAHLGIDPVTNPDYRLPQAHVELYERGRSLMLRMAAEYPNCRVVPTSDLFIDDGGVLVMRDRKVLYMDDNHLTDEGASLAESRIAAAIAALRRRGEAP